jgi:hypothetical protein
MSQGRMQYPDPEVIPQAKRRRFSAEYNLRVLAGRIAVHGMVRLARCCAGKGFTRRT